MKNNKTDFILWAMVAVFVFLPILGIFLDIKGKEQGGQDLEYKAVLKAKTGVFKFETESERCFVANKVGYAPSISCVNKRTGGNDENKN